MRRIVELSDIIIPGHDLPFSTFRPPWLRTSGNGSDLARPPILPIPNEAFYRAPGKPGKGPTLNPDCVLP